MDVIYENSSFIESTVASDVKLPQNKGNSTENQECVRDVSIPKWTKVLLIGLTVLLVFALGGLVVLGIQYVNVSMQLSAQETNGKIKERVIGELTANYTRVVEDLHHNEIEARELTANYTRVKEQLSLYEAQSLNYKMNLADFHGKLHFFSDVELTWSSSRDFCVSKGADLVTITSKEEQTYLHSKVRSWYWIGLTDVETEGRWVWVNGQTLQETGVQFWHQRQSQKSEPDNWKEADPSGEHCAIVKNDFGSTDSWFDVSCKYNMKFICEKKY